MNGTLADLSRFHDAELTSLSFSRTVKKVRLEFLTESGRTLRIVCRGVQGFRAVDVGTQNVVSQAISTLNNALKEDEIRHSLNWISSMIDAPSYLSPQSLETYLAKIRSGDVCLLMIDASSGGSVGVLAERVEIESD